MKRRRSMLAEGVAAAIIALLVSAGLGSAHTASNWYGLKWKAGERNQDYGFGDGVPTGNFRDRVQDGAQEWNALAGNMQFRRGGVNVTWGFGFDCANRRAGENSIHYGSIDGGPQPGEFNTYARTRYCVYADNRDKLFSIAIKFDSGDSWYSGTGDPPNDKVDTWAVAAHEFGHAGGFGTGDQDHFPAGTDICTQPNKQTMCQGLPYGAKFWRSLEQHDRHTFNGAY